VTTAAAPLRAAWLSSETIRGSKEYGNVEKKCV